MVKKYVQEGIPNKQITLEKTFRGFVNNKHTSNTPDVFVNHNGGIAIYCQTHNRYPWLYDFIDRLPFINGFSKKQIIVLPNNIEALKPINMQRYFQILSKFKIEVIIAPISIPIQNKKEIRTVFTYNALFELCKLRDKHSPNKRLIDFIENDIKKLVKKRL